MKNLLMLGTMLAVLITSDAATTDTQAKLQADTLALQWLLPAPPVARLPPAPVLQRASFQPVPGALPQTQGTAQNSPNQPAPWVLLSVAVGLLLLRMRSSHGSEKFSH